MSTLTATTLGTRRTTTMTPNTSVPIQGRESCTPTATGAIHAGTSPITIIVVIFTTQTPEAESPGASFSPWA